MRSITSPPPPGGRIITIIALGSRGDVQPALALAWGLRRSGHTVRVATHASQEFFVVRQGFEFRLIRPDLGAMLQEQRVRDSMERGNVDMIVSFCRIMRELRGELDDMANDMLAACRGSHALVFPKVYGSAGYYIAKELGIPSIAMALQPADPTGDFATLALPPAINLGRRLNAFSHAVAINALAWQPFRAAAQRMMREHFPDRRIPALGPYQAMRAEQTPTLYAFSEHVVPKPSDWDSFRHVTGYWWLDNDTWTPPDELTRFLGGGPPPVYVGFGSMPALSPRIGALVLDALRMSGQRAVLGGRWNGLTDGAGEDMLMVNDVPHAWLFPRMAAVVHHSGAGTTAATLRAGRPSINVPFFLDQPYWAHRVQSLGVGPAPIPMRQLNAERLGGAIRATIEDSPMRERCVELAGRLARDRGVDSAVDVIESVID